MSEEQETEKGRLVRFGVRPRKQLGQNFLIHPSGAERLVRAMPVRAGDCVVEIGSGGGSLTRALLDVGCRVWGVEIDRGLQALLGERFVDEAAEGRFVLIGGDVLKTGIADFPGAPVTPLHVAGNLPYYATTDILLWTLRERRHVRTASFLVQREFAERIAAAPGGKAYSSLTVWIAYHAAARRVLSVAPGSFWPVPEVQSALVSLAFHTQPPHPLEDPARLEETLAWTFQHRRKMLRASLAAALGGPDRAAAALDRAGVAPERRPETLTLEEFVRLTRAIAEVRG